MSLTLPKRQQKQELRQKLKQKLKVISDVENAKLVTQVSNWLNSSARDQLKLEFGLAPSSSCEVWGSFRALANEPNLDAVEVSSPNKLRWAYPLVVGEHLKFFICSFDQMQKGAFGIYEPDPLLGAREVQISELSGLFIPGLGFDRNGNRLGRGRGFYDRALEGFCGLKIGVGFSCSLVDEINSEEHDIKLDVLITEEEILYFKRS